MLETSVNPRRQYAYSRHTVLSGDVSSIDYQRVEYRPIDRYLLALGDNRRWWDNRRYVHHDDRLAATARERAGVHSLAYVAVVMG